MRTGFIISGTGHMALILWLLLGGLFARVDEPEFTATDAVILSESDFALLSQPGPPPEDPAPAADAPPAPEEAPAPALPSADDAPTTAGVPEIPETAEPDSAPDVSAIAETARPEVASVAPDAPVSPPEEPEENAPVTAHDAPPDSAPAPADRVAPSPAPPPEPEVRIADSLQPARQPDESRTATEEVQQETAPEAAAPEIVTEAETVRDAVARASPRPPSRPARPAPAADPPPDAPTPESDSLNDTIEEAIARANEPADTTPDTTPRAFGPPLTQGERDALRVAVQTCWQVDVGSEAANITVVIGMSMDRDGKVVNGSLKLLSSEGGSGRAAEIAFQAARRAILRCQRGGYQLPVEKYDHWREIEMTFNPETMRTR